MLSFSSHFCTYGRSLHFQGFLVLYWILALGRWENWELGTEGKGRHQHFRSHCNDMHQRSLFLVRVMPAVDAEYTSFLTVTG